MKLKAPFIGAVNIHAEQIGRQHIVGKLHPPIIQPQHRRQRMRQRSFAHARHIFEQHMAAGQNAGEQLAQHCLLAQNQAVELLQRFFDRNIHIKSTHH